MNPIPAYQIAASLNHIGIICTAVCEGDPESLEHGEVSIKLGKRIMTLFVSPVDDTMYLAVWHPVKTRKGIKPDDGSYAYSPVYHYAGQFHQILRHIREGL